MSCISWWPSHVSQLPAGVGQDFLGDTGRAMTSSQLVLNALRSHRSSLPHRRFSYWMVQHYFPCQASAGILAKCHVSLCIIVQRQLTVGSQMLHSHPSLAWAAPQEIESSKVEITFQHPSFPTSKHCRTTLGCEAFIHLKVGITLSWDLFEIYMKCIAGAVQCNILLL